jgi:alkylation response protein AidB-like acyl-CoA dehydrogenase
VDFGFNEDQELLRSVVRDYLRTKTPTTFARAMMDDPVGTTEEVWRGVADLGWLGLTVPEAYGGSGLGFLDLAIVMEEAGAVCLPGPFMSTAALAIPAIATHGTESQKRHHLPEIAAGTARATVAFAESDGRWAEDAVAATAELRGEQYVLRGTKLFVPDARSADWVLVVANVAGGSGIFVVPREARGFTIEPMHTIDQTRKLDVVELNDVHVDAEALLGGARLPDGALDRLVDVARVLLAAEMCGAADAALTLSVEYVKIREQFDRKIATFQAIQHKLADMKVLLENARSLAYYAAWALDTGSEDQRIAAAMTKAYASDACVKVVADAIQVHGGIGFTWEHDLQLYFKRVKSSELTYGDATANRRAVAEALKL